MKISAFYYRSTSILTQVCLPIICEKKKCQIFTSLYFHTLFLDPSEILFLNNFLRHHSLFQCAFRFQCHIFYCLSKHRAKKYIFVLPWFCHLRCHILDSFSCWQPPRILSPYSWCLVLYFWFPLLPCLWVLEIFFLFLPLTRYHPHIWCR